MTVARPGCFPEELEKARRWRRWRRWVPNSVLEVGWLILSNRIPPFGAME